MFCFQLRRYQIDLGSQEDKMWEEIQILQQAREEVAGIRDELTQALQQYRQRLHTVLNALGRIQTGVGGIACEYQQLKLASKELPRQLALIGQNTIRQVRTGNTCTV